MNVYAKAYALGASLIIPCPSGNESAILYRISLFAPGPKAIEWNSILLMIVLSYISLLIPDSGNDHTPSDMK
jgi:hypothetical protein